MFLNNSERTLLDDAVLARRPLADGRPSQVILRAFAELETDLSERERPLADFVDPDAIDELIEAADENVQVSAVVWGQLVVVTTEEVFVFEQPTSVAELDHGH